LAGLVEFRIIVDENDEEEDEEEDNVECGSPIGPHVIYYSLMDTTFRGLCKAFLEEIYVQPGKPQWWISGSWDDDLVLCVSLLGSVYSL